MRSLLDRLLHEERGSVLVIVAGFLPVAIALAAFVIEVGNGMEHDRYLQLEADAGALAAAQEFNGCHINETAANDAIEEVAINYATERNTLVGSPEAQARVTPVINGTGYDSLNSSAGEPCDTGFVDVKLTEAGSPTFFGFGDKDYRGHARVQVLKVQRLNGLLPLAVPAPDPNKAAAIFVDEATGTVLKTVPLERTAAENGLDIWQNSGADPVVSITGAHVGLRIALSGGSSTTCGDALVTCYDAGSTAGLVHIQGWSGAGTVAPGALNGGTGSQGTPLVRSVTLVPGSACPDAYYSSPSLSCNRVGVNATVDFGGNPSNVGGGLTAVVGGASYPLTFSAGTWTTGAVIPIPVGAGPVNVTLNWEETKGKIGNSNCSDKNNNPCDGTFGIVQRHFSATEARSGPIELAQLSGPASPNSLQRCSAVLSNCDNSLHVKIGISGSLAVADESSPPQYLRIQAGSRTQALDCNPTSLNFKEELVAGCEPWYTKNTGTTCPSHVTTLTQPWQCVQVENGNMTNQIAAGLNERILGDDKAKTCPSAGAFGHNNWPNYVTGDPRIVHVFLTGFGAFDPSGGGSVPVTGFATFYITGWTAQGNGFANPCQGHGDEVPHDAGEIVGRYIPFIETPNDGEPGEELCDFGGITPCVAVLVD